MRSDWLKLKSGSDIRGEAIEHDGVKVQMTDELAETASYVFACFLAEKLGKTPADLTIAVGRDSRLSGPRLATAAMRGLTNADCDVLDCGMCTTPAMFMTTVSPETNCDGAIMVTASHLPFNRNGFKFFTKDGGLDKKDIARILELAEEDAAKGAGECDPRPAQVTDLALMDAYCVHLQQVIRTGVTDGSTGAPDVAAAKKAAEKPLAGMKIVVDAGNGAGGFFAERVLAPLGADTAGSRYLDPDGRFPNHVPNPELPEAMDSIREAVLESHADFGVIFDTDVDRAGAVLSNGEELNRNRLIALISAILLREHPGTAIVTDSITSTGLAEFIAAHGGVHRRFRRGYRNVINEALRLNAAGQDCQLAIETSGHAALKENYFLDDGAYLVTRFLMEIAAGRSLESLLEGLYEPVESREFRLKILAEDFRAAGTAVLDSLAEYAKEQPGWSIAPDNCEGVRVNLDKAHGDGWFLLRLSLHDPILPLNIESDREHGARTIARELAPFLAQQVNIDASSALEFTL